jgi:predicted nucleotidyltransferase
MHTPGVALEGLDVDALRSALARDDRVTAAYLFGSVARGTARKDSDVDIALLLRQKPPPTLAAQLFALEDDLRGFVDREVQLVTLNTAPIDLVHRVLRDGVMLYERDRAARLRFEVQARNAYFDLQPLLRRYRQAVLR